MASISRPTLDPGELEVAVESGADRLEDAAEQLSDATLRFEEAEHKWDELRLLEYARLYHAQVQDGKRLPGEEVRLALVVEKFKDDPIYVEYFAAKAKMNALDKRFRALSAAVNARQSLLRRI